MRAAALLLILSCLLILPVQGQDASAVPYKIDFDPARDVEQLTQYQGKQSLFLRVRFTVSVVGVVKEEPGKAYNVIIEEEGKVVRQLDVPRPTPSEDLSAVLVLDTSGSMRGHGRMIQAKAAANVFLDKLPSKADCGLILFDHEVRPPIVQPTPNRSLLKGEIAKVEPRGGTAYLDAAFEGVKMLAKVPSNKEKALVVLTDGLDLNSKKKLPEVIREAQKHKIRVYTIGIGEPGKLEVVSTALVLDHSGSMTPPANDQDKTPKIKALHIAASRFVSFLPSTGRVSLIPFSSVVGMPKAFRNDQHDLSRDINGLNPEGETALFDAIYAGIATLEADGSKGKRAVVAMTDGVDNSSRRRKEEVIQRAKEADIRLFLLGFGREHEVDGATMKEMADATGGQYHHAPNEQALVKIFEDLSIGLHDDGIDEATLKQLAHDTGGQYYPAKDVGQLRFILEQVTQSIQKKSYEEVFESTRPVADGSPRRVAIYLKYGDLQVSNIAKGEFIALKGGEVIGPIQTGDIQVTGVVVAEMNHLIYLFFLAILGALIALPAWMSRLATRS